MHQVEWDHEISPNLGVIWPAISVVFKACQQNVVYRPVTRRPALLENGVGNRKSEAIALYPAVARYTWGMLNIVDLAVHSRHEGVAECHFVRKLASRTRTLPTKFGQLFLDQLVAALDH
jgi:hypothetical protein